MHLHRCQWLKEQLAEEDLPALLVVQIGDADSLRGPGPSKPL